MKILLFNYNNVLTDVADELEKRGHVLLPLDGKDSTLEEADALVVWNELAGWKEMIEKAQKMGKRTVLVQHGRRGSSRILPPFNEVPISDAICVWGESDKKRMESVGVPSEKIHITGTSVLRHLKSRVPHEGTNVVFSPEHWDTDVVENVIVRGQLSKLKDVSLTTKLLTDSHNIAEYENPVVSDRSEEGHLEICADLLSRADIVVGISESTFELMAETLDIPIVIADIWIPKACNGDDRYKEYHREYSNACTRVSDISKLNETITEVLQNPEQLRKERAEISLLDGGINIADPVEEIIKVIENGN